MIKVLLIISVFLYIVLGHDTYKRADDASLHDLEAQVTNMASQMSSLLADVASLKSQLVALGKILLTFELLLQLLHFNFFSLPIHVLEKDLLV